MSPLRILTLSAAVLLAGCGTKMPSHPAPKSYCEVVKYNDDFWGQWHPDDGTISIFATIGWKTKEDAEVWCKSVLHPAESTEPKVLETIR